MTKQYLYGISIYIVVRRTVATPAEILAERECSVPRHKDSQCVVSVFGKGSGVLVVMLFEFCFVLSIAETFGVIFPKDHVDV